MNKISIFVCYNRKDNRWFEDEDQSRFSIIPWLARFFQGEYVELWYDRGGLQETHGHSGLNVGDPGYQNKKGVVNRLW